MLGVAAFAAIAVWSHDPADLLWSSEPVLNRGGRLGVLFAAALVGSVGVGSYFVVAALGFVGARFLAGFGMPGLSSRVGAALLLLFFAAVSMPALLRDALPRFATLEGGALGEFLAGQEAWLLGTWGALLANGLLAGIGLLGMTGISLGRVLGRVGIGVGIGFVVFGDATLRDLARLRPSTKEALRGVKGVGDQKLADLGERFLDAIAEYEAKG
jgi:hypothetical protein